VVFSTSRRHILGLAGQLSRRARCRVGVVSVAIVVAIGGCAALSGADDLSIRDCAPDCPESEAGIPEKLCQTDPCGSCVDRVDDARCGIGKICDAGVCTPGSCHDDVTCAAVGKACDAEACSACIDTVEDARCGPGKICVAGSCKTGDCRTRDACDTLAQCIQNACVTWGDGHDGSLVVPFGTTRSFESLAAAHAVSAIVGTSATVSSTTGFASGDEVLLVNLRGSPTDTTSVGNFELLGVTAVGPNALTFASAPTKSYGNAGANANLAGQSVFAIRVPNFTTVDVAGTLTTKAWAANEAGLGVIAFRASGSVNVGANGSITTSGAGFRGSGTAGNGVSGHSGESVAPIPSNNCYGAPGWCPNFGGGSGGIADCNADNCTAQQLGAGGGGASYGTTGAAGENNGALQRGGPAGIVYGDTSLSRLFLGAGGGGGAGGVSGPGSSTAGGNGGGMIIIASPAISVAGSIVANGRIGSTNDNCSLSQGSGSGGGGAGGSIWIRSTTINIATVTAGPGPARCHGGGAGGAGRIRIDYGSINGAAYPAGSPSATSPAAYLSSVP
jgi:hypothetical protein